MINKNKTSVGWLQAGWSALSLPPLDVPPLSEEGGDWSPLVSLLLFMFGSAIAYWGSALLGLSLSLLSVPLSAIHRYPASIGFHCHALGRRLAGLVVARRQLWLSQAKVPDVDKSTLLDAPVSPGHTSGPAVEEILQSSHRERGPLGIDAQANKWPNALLYAFPLLPLLPSFFEKVLIDNMTVLLVAPNGQRMDLLSQAQGTQNWADSNFGSGP
ncbi:UNVERIFIED_CONTAM: hypothetical protein FKN15_040455 [Acipenser sinensis]